MPPATTIVVHPCDETSLRGAVEAAEAGIIVPILVGPADKIAAVAREHELDIGRFEIVDAPHSDAAAAKAVELIHEAKGELLMKGSLHTDELMRAVTASATGLRTARRISHVFVMDVPTYAETLFITDAAINIFPDLDAKRDIIQNAIDLFTQIGLGTPRVAILSAVETVTSKIPSTIEAAALCKMAERGQITGGLLDGPLAFDNAIDPEAARIKGIKSEVAGRAQILVVPDLEAGNMLAKNLTFLAKADAAGIVLGARVPIILTSRADSVRTRMASCAVAVLYADARRRAAAAAGSVTAMDTILVVNAGSSSVKFQVFGSSGAASLQRLIKGQMDGIGTRPRLRAEGARRRVAGRPDLSRRTTVADRRRPRCGPPAAWLRETQKFDLIAVGHRVVHGGPDYDRPVLVDDEVLARPRALRPAGAAAPAEQPGADPRVCCERRPDCRRSPASTPRSIAATAPWPTTTPFPSASMPRASAATAFTACPTNTSPSGCGEVAPDIAGGRVIVAHLGSGASMCALSRRPQRRKHAWASPRSTACRWARGRGQLDPGVVLYLIDRERHERRRRCRTCSIATAA